MNRFASLIVVIALVLVGSDRSAFGQAPDSVLRQLNRIIDATSAGGKSYTLLFDAYLDMTPAPSTTGTATAAFNVNTIHNLMDNWQAVSDWAESNPHVAEAIHASRNKVMFGLPYGEARVDQKYRSENLVARIGVDGDLRETEFPYLDAMDTILAYSTAETYRLLEADLSERAVDLMLSTSYVFYQLLDRRFYDEMIRSTKMMNDYMQVMRDVMYVYRDVIPMEFLRRYPYEEGASGNQSFKQGIAGDLPFLRIDLLQMPDGERVLAEAIIHDVFGESESPDPEKFVEIFSAIQAEELPLTRFGAARRWRMISLIHSSKTATLEHLQLVFDDWQRRWDIRDYQPLLDLPTQYARTNAIRYAAVIAAMRDIEALFDSRRQLRASVNATAISAGFNAYRKQFNDTYPDDIKKTYAQFILKRIDQDAYDRDEGVFGFKFSRTPIKILTNNYGFVEVRGPILWSKGRDHQSQNAVEHRDDGTAGDIVYWPPLRALAREQGLVE